MAEDAILVMGGAFSPVHSGHLAAMQAAKEHVEQRLGARVVAGYLACATSQYCNRKYGGKVIPESARVSMCNLLATEPDAFLRETPRAYGCARACAAEMVGLNHAKTVRVFIVCGADKAAKRPKRDHVYIARDIGVAVGKGTELVAAPPATLAVSATQVRGELQCQPLQSALRRMVAEGMLPRTIAEYMAANSHILARIAPAEGLAPISPCDVVVEPRIGAPGPENAAQGTSAIEMDSVETEVLIPDALPQPAAAAESDLDVNLGMIVAELQLTDH